MLKLGYLHVLYNDNRVETINNVTRVTNLSNKSKYLYYETFYDTPGRGKCIENDEK